MKKNYWLVLGLSVATVAVAQDTNMAPPADQPAPAITEPSATTAPSAAPAPKKVIHHRKRKPAAAEQKETAMVEHPMTLVPGPAEVIAKYVNVRGQPSLKGEVVTHLTTNDSVTVVEQINLKRHKAGEPAQWAKIAFPTNANVWVFSRFIDETNKVVLSKKLNLRTGPGENYSVAGLIERGTPINQVSTKGNWTEIEPPTNAYAFVAAMYLKQEANPAPMVAPVETNVVEQPPAIAPEMTNAPAETNAVATEMETNPPAVETEAPPPPPRIVEHVGVVRHVISPVAPTDYEIFDPASGKTVDYLYTTSTNLNLSLYKGHRIIVTGEEGLDERWKDTPVITIQQIQVVK
jgi:uncharacterized protein YgiM (DUF1202 family)